MEKNEAIKSLIRICKVSTPLAVAFVFPIATHAATIATDGSDDPAERIAAMVYSICAGILAATLIKIFKRPT